MNNNPVYLLEDLRRWFKEKWTAQDGSPCGGYTGKGRVKCRPSKKVSSKTAQTWGEMSKKQKRKAIRLKQKAHRRGHQFSSHKTGKTWEGKKYSPKKVKKTIKEAAAKPSKAEMKHIMSYLKGSVNNPARFYYLLLLSGMNGGKANSILFDLKNPNLRTANPFYRKRMLALLKNIIDAITKDQLLYNRVRSMALSGNLTLHEQEGAATGGGMAGGESGVAGGMSVGVAFIEGMPDATPAEQTPGPSWGSSPPPKKKNRKRLVKMYQHFANLHRRNNAN
jgi:hypothetical protein